MSLEMKFHNASNYQDQILYSIMLTKLLSLPEERTFISEGLIALFGSLLIALCSQLSLYLPFTTIPLSLQSNAVYLLSALVGRKRALMITLVYLVEGLCGAPFFAMGRGGIAVLFSPSFGYLLSYLPVSYLIGALFDKVERPPFMFRWAVFLFGNAITLLVGTLWLTPFLGWKKAVLIGLTPFPLIAVMKDCTIALLYPYGRRLLGQDRRLSR